ncbi:response regulator [Singulisphaera acidiphila]|uniref:Response regulator containing a CheY-like receiver domain and a GGDEF domain n=1 Tax=Singulisphaera acidiphila (strain ATCC BAA-1392 / DSM 18658 / VKM B-2454 / MOB10) TaxID=886293 RepID=L0DGF7_SINAD|nr:response regulator [Singulisphaera acidiphila]AGA27930.1 response regulator containing a CheY-like receiver domain and a GGDEF domain [Singulisphaera acidiphila DSM 18658]
MRVLIVDDSRAIRSILSRILVGLGFEVYEAGHGREGLQRLAEIARTSLVLVDWTMPEMDGLEFVRAVRSRPEYDHLKLMMVTAETEMDRVADALEQGADEYLMKPFTRDMIVQKLELLGMMPASVDPLLPPLPPTT